MGDLLLTFLFDRELGLQKLTKRGCEIFFKNCGFSKKDQGISTISSKEVDVKKWGIKYTEGDWTSLLTMDPDINEYKTYIVTLLKVWESLS